MFNLLAFKHFLEARKQTAVEGDLKASPSFAAIFQIGVGVTLFLAWEPLILNPFLYADF